MGDYKNKDDERANERSQRDTQRLPRLAKFPDGSRCFATQTATHCFQVKVCYREPDVETRTGRRRDKPFSWTFEVRALSPAGAQVEAVRQFRETEKQSSVNWAREIVDVIVVEWAG